MASQVGEITDNRGTAVSLVAVAVALIALVAGGWRLGSDVVPAVFAAESSLSGFRQSSEGQLLTQESLALRALSAQLAEVDSEIQSAGRFMRWVRRFSSAYSWVPVAHQEMSAWGGQMERAQKDLEAAAILLDSAATLFDVYTDAQAAITEARPSSPVSPLKAKVQGLESAFEDSHRATTDAKRVGRTFGVGLQVTRARDLTRVLGELEDRALTASTIGRQVSGLLVDLLELADSAQPLMGQFVIDGFEPDAWTVETLAATLAAIGERTRSSMAKSEAVAGLVADTEQADWLMPRLAALDRLLIVLLKVSAAGKTSLDVLEPAARAMGSSGAGLFGAEGDLTGIFEPFVERGDEIAAAIADLEEAQRILGDLALESGDLLPTTGLSDISRFVADLRSGLKLVSEIAPKGAFLVGADGVRRYLVLGQSADEIRATGGFVSSAWIVTFENGRLADVRYKDTVAVDDWDRLDLYPKAPPGLDEHMNAWVWLFRDVSWDPDFPTTARTAEDIYRLGQRMDVDGVVAINQWTLLRLIDALGNISAPGGEPVTSRNLLAVLERGTDEHGRAYMDLVVQGLLDRLSEPMTMPTLIRMASGLSDTLQSRDMLLFFDDVDLQAVAGEAGWDGRIRQAVADYLYVVDSNVGWSKVDRNIQRDISYSIDLSRDTSPRASLTLGYDNHSGPGSPGCEPQWLNRGDSYGELKNACYWNFLRIYTPQGSRLLSSSPLLLPEYAVSVEIGRGIPGQDTAAVASSHNKTVFSGLSTLEAGGRREVNFVYDLPGSVLRREGDSVVYELLIQKQPGVRRRTVSVELVPPDGYSLFAISAPAVLVDEFRATIDFTLERDTVLSVEFRKDIGEVDKTG